MSIVLPQELKSQKTNSLPDDLKAIAEALIAEKFDVKEEVIPERDDFFLDPTQFSNGPNPFRDEPDVRDRRGFRDRDVSEITVHTRPWDRNRVAEIEISYPTFENLVVANRKLDMENIRGRRREFIMHPEFYDFLRRDRQVGMYLVHFDGRGRVPEGAKDVVGEIMGCPIIVTPGVRHCILTTEF